MLSALSGCGASTLETGYKPKKLDMSLSQRKALYADPYSPVAQDAQQEQATAPQHRPGQP